MPLKAHRVDLEIDGAAYQLLAQLVGRDNSLGMQAILFKLRMVLIARN